MGGSGSTSSVGGGGEGIKGGECPRKFEAVLIDVLQSGNAGDASALKAGDKLAIVIASDESGLILSHDNKNIGYLPPQYNNLIQCIKDGWSYSASVLSVMGSQTNPQVKVLVVGAP